MLGKLIKHEWKSVSKMGILMIIGTLIASALAFISFRSPMWVRLMSDAQNVKITPFDLLGMFGVVMYVIVLVCISYGMIIYLGIHFYKSMYSNEGYLTHTLPVTPHQLLISKILVGGLWNLIICLMVIFSVLVLVFSLIFTILAIEYPNMGLTQIMSMLETEHFFGYLTSEFQYSMGIHPVSYGFIMLLLLVIGSFTGVTQLYGAVTIGQLSRKYKILMSIVAYIGIMVFNNIISFLVSIINTFRAFVQNDFNYNMIRYNTAMESTYVIILIQAILLGSLLYFLSHYIITRKLNLD